MVERVAGPTLAMCVGEVGVIGGEVQSNFVGGNHVDAVSLQAADDSSSDVCVEVKPNLSQEAP